MPLDFDVLFDLLTDVVMDGGPSVAEFSAGEGGDAPDLFGDSWNSFSHDPAGLDSFEDIDGDGIPNYADEHFGPGARDPFGALAVEDGEYGGARSADGAEVAADDVKGTAGDAEEPSSKRPQVPAETDSLAAGAEEAVTVVGTPESDSAHWSVQEGANSCAVASQKGVIEAVTGMCIPESQLSEIAESNGWYDPNAGTAPQAVGNLLEAYGIPVTRQFDTTFTELYDALQRGEKVIVGLDANEIWTPRVGFDGQPLEAPDSGHAVWVTGIEMQDDGTLNVVMNDTGLPNGQSVAVPIEHFRNAWADFGNFSVTTQTQQSAHA